jgi:hypothetical protein
MFQHPNRLWLIVFFLAWVFDQLFWDVTPGVSFAIFVAALLAGGLLWLWQAEARPNRRALALIPLILFFAVFTFLRAEPLTTFLNYAITLVLLMIFALTYLGGRWMSYSLLDYMAGMFRLAFAALAEPVKFQLEAVKQRAESDVPVSKSALMPIVRGILLALPIVAIFAALLASADAVFESRLVEFIELFRLEKLPEYLVRAVFIAIMGYGIAGILLYAATRSRDPQLVGEEKPVVPAFVGITESAIVLGSVATLFVSFLIIQFQYFFGGRVNINLTGFTYSEYARRGFGELVVVAFFTLLLIFVFGALTRRETQTHQTLFSGISVVLVAQVMVMLVSAYQRLVLYEEAYGFSRLRTYTHVFIIWLGLLLLVTAALDVLKRPRAFAMFALFASLGFAISLNILNVDGFIVRQNVARVFAGESLDAQTIASLSSDATPQLLYAYRNSSLPDAVRADLAAALFCRYTFYNDNFDGVTYAPARWQSFHWADYQQQEAFKTAATLPYQANSERWLSIMDKNGNTFSCAERAD